MDTRCESVNSPNASESIEACSNKLKKKNLTNEQRQAIVHSLILQYSEGKLKKNAVSDIASAFNVHRKTISVIWNRAKAAFSSNDMVCNVDSLKKGRSGRKRKDWSEELDSMRSIELNRRSTLRSLSYATGIPKTTLFRMMNDGHVKRISSTVKPTLTEQNKLERLQFCLRHVRPNGIFCDMYDYVHIDEKWFYITETKKSYYLLADEEPPERSCKSKRFITKVMFMAAVARPQYDSHRKCYFDGRVGIWPFVERTPAQRNSKNRPKGTLETKPIVSVNKEVVKQMIIDNIMPSIREKMPISRRGNPVYIQQDNAKPHTCGTDELLTEEGSRDGWNIVITNQPPNSPDFNVLDLGFFNAIQSLQHKEAPKTVDDLIKVVEDSFNAITRETLDNTFLTYQSAMESAMKAGGSNQYKLVHMGKEKLRREGKLPVSIICDPNSISAAHEALNM